MSYQGLIAELPIGAAGLTGSNNQSRISPAHLILTDNITFENGTLQKEGGATKINSSAISGVDIIGGWDWIPSAGLQRQIVIGDNGTVYREPDDGTFSSIKTGLTVSDINPTFVEGGAEVAANNKKLFLFTEKNVVQILSGDGTSMSDITSPPTDWSSTNQPIAGVIHENRLWGFGNLNDPHRIYASLPADHEDFTNTPLTFSVYPGEGERIIAATSFKGLLIVFKFPRGIYLVDTSNSDTSKWRVTRHTQNIGMASPLGLVAIDDDILFMDATGSFQILSTVTEFGNLGSRNLSTRPGIDFDTFVRSFINTSKFKFTKSIYYSEKNVAMFSVNQTGETLNSAIISVDFNIADEPRFRFSTRDAPTALWLRRDSDDILRPAIGDTDGFAWDLDTDTRSKDGSGYEGSFRSPNEDMSFLDPQLGTRNKNFEFLELVAEPSGNFNLSVDIFIDDALSQTITFNLGTDSSTLGTFVLGTDKLGGDTLISKKQRITGSGRRISLAGSNSGVGQDFSLAKFYVHFTPSDERIS